MTYIVRLDLRGTRGVRYGTVDKEALHVSYQPQLRAKRRSPLGFREMEKVGVDRSRVWLRFRSDTFVNDRGTRGLYPGNTQFRLLERHQHIRALAPSSAELLAGMDAQIAAKEEELRALRDARVELMKLAWRKGEKVDISTLEEKANAHV